MFGKKKPVVHEVPKPLPIPKPQVIEAEEPMESYEEDEEESEQEETEAGLTEEMVVAYLKNYGERIQNLEAALFRMKGAI
ncbi:MAG TPA: hypothetical protein PK957_05085 [Candidatus Dojkabacteria bacterium]|nr:hypothetical protein [Candidatus Dojkabacteria bacterium]HPJ87111.1 hypothetical protein [Candidatus Pacearchaeota archaeon]